jgi:endonuclease/exonuclease/phosphatase (EEP) superfamily protein YafD
MSAPPEPHPPTAPTVRIPAYQGPPPPRRPEPPRSGGQGRPRRRIVGRLVGAIVVAAGVSIFVVPDLWGRLDRWSPFTQLVAFRPLIVVAVAALTLVLALVTLGLRKAWPFPVAMLVVVGLGASMLVPRMIADPLPTSGAELKVLSFNVYEGQADVQDIADLIHEQRPDVVSFPEAGERFRAKLQPLIEDIGYTTRSSVQNPRGQDVDSVTAAVSPRLGDVSFEVGKMGGWSPFPYLEVSGGGLGNLTFVAFHSVAPTPGSVEQWETDLGGLAPWCSGDAPYVIAGDYNATMDHSVLREATAGCADAASQRGSSLTATWPTSTPRWLGTEIDHVFANAGTQAESYEVLDLPGSDHRAVLTTLRTP